MELNNKYWNGQGKYRYFCKYSFETIRYDCLREIECINFKYPERCRRVSVDGRKVWKQYLGAGILCEPEKKDDKPKTFIIRVKKNRRKPKNI